MRLRISRAIRRTIGFQSTHPRGVRPMLASPLSVTMAFQSTHPRGVRRDGLLPLLRGLDFNPRTHVGCDPAATPAPRAIFYFNPRTHVGCDALGVAGADTVAYFNPRTHVGCDLGSVSTLSSGLLFQSTHPRGVRRQGCPRTHG